MNDTANIKSEFLDSLKRGTGRALLIIKAYRDIDFSKEIIKGATTNFAYDQQCEGSRAWYINQLIKSHKNSDKIRLEILKRLENKKTDYYGLDQLFDLAVLFNKSGVDKAVKAINNRFDKNRLDDFEFCGQEQLMEVDGIKGVLKVAETVGEILSPDDDDYEDSWRIDEFQRKNKQIDVYSELEKASLDNAFVKTYYDSIRSHKWRIPRKKKLKRFTYELIHDKISSGKFRIITKDRANDLTDVELQKLANDFLKEKDPIHKTAYLRFFVKRKFPSDYKPILKIARGRNPRKTKLVESALESLKFFKSDELRSFVLDNIFKVKYPCDYLPILVSNYQQGDFGIINEIIDKSDDYDYIHSLVFGIIDIYRNNSTLECKEPLEKMYSKLNCGLHRFDIVNLLIDNKVLSDRIAEELRYDSYDEIRKIYRQRVKTAGNNVYNS